MRRWYSPVRPRLVAAIIGPALPAWAGRTPVRFSCMPVYVRLRLSAVATWWWWSTVAIVRIAAAWRRWVVVHRRAATWWAIAVFARVLVVATRWRSAATVVIATRAVATWWAAAIVVLVGRWRTITTATIAWRAGAEALAWARHVRLRLVLISIRILWCTAVCRWRYIRDAANGSVLEGGIVKLLDSGREIRSSLVFDEAAIVSQAA